MNPFHLKIKSYFLFLITLTFTNFIYAQTSKEKSHSIIAKGAVLTKLSDQFSFTEGPASDKKGNIYFTDQPNNRIMKWSVNGKLSVFMENAGRANGLYFDHKGNLLACADEKNELWKIDKNKNYTVLLNKRRHLFYGPFLPKGLLETYLQRNRERMRLLFISG
jgi:gluconolactonase